MQTVVEVISPGPFAVRSPPFTTLPPAHSETCPTLDCPCSPNDFRIVWIQWKMRIIGKFYNPDKGYWVDDHNVQFLTISGNPFLRCYCMTARSAKIPIESCACLRSSRSPNRLQRSSGTWQLAPEPRSLSSAHSTIGSGSSSGYRATLASPPAPPPDPSPSKSRDSTQ